MAPDSASPRIEWFVFQGKGNRMAKKRYILLFVYPYELKDVDERRGLLLRSFDGERLYNGARLSVERVTDEDL